jgi:hypothetical protein
MTTVLEADAVGFLSAAVRQHSKTGGGAARRGVNHVDL